MALFKLLRGQESDLTNQPLHDGYVWVTKDLQNMWFDYYDETNTLVRKRINSEYADKLRYIKNGETVELNPSDIATIDGTVKKSKQLDISDFGNYTNKTVGELQERINSWLENNLNVGAMFMAKGNWPTVWNNGSSSVISDGRTYTATVVATYQNTNYIQLMISTYGTKEIFFVVKEVGEWKNVVKNAFQDDIDTLLLSVDNKVDKVNGKGLSTNDYTTAEKNKLAGIADGANNYVLPSATDSVVGGMKLYTSTGSNTAGTMTQKAITDALAGKSGTGHNHDSVYSKLGHTHTAAEVGATTQTYVDNQIKDAKSYTDTKVAGLVDSAPETLNTLNELAAALGDDPNFATTMATELGSKATKTELNTHASSNIHITSTERTNWTAAKTHADSAHAPSNAERNIIIGIQKNGTDVSVNSTTRKVNITVPTKTSELTNNSDFATNASVTSVKEELQANIDGKANSSHNHAASNITSGTLSSDRLPTVPVAKGGTGATTAAGALTNLGLTATAAELNVLDGITATTAELNKLDGVTATTAELNYVDGVTSNIQTQLNGKASTDHKHDMKELEGFFIELNYKGTKGTGHGGYLDFHYDGSGADYTSRIIESANGTLSINGVKCKGNNVTCSALEIANGATKNKASGYVKLNNGIILQWGTVSNLANGNSKWVTFPIAFPTAVGGSPMLTGNYGNSFGYELHANDIAATGFTIVKRGGSSTTGTDTVSWLAVGW